MVECYRCHDSGHFQYECPKMNKELNYAELEEEDEMLLMAHMERHEAKMSDAWLLDSGCSNHMCALDSGCSNLMCASECMFSSLDKTFFHIVKLGNNTSMKVMGKGAVKLTLHGVRCTISNVYWVHELKNNFLNVEQLQEKEVVVLFKDDVCAFIIHKKEK